MQPGKRPKALLDQVPDLASAEQTHSEFRPILDYVLEHAQNDERPYLRVNILGREILGLLDSGASRTICGGYGWRILKELGLNLDRKQTPSCRVANGNICSSIGVCEIPMKVRDRLRLIKVIVIPDVPHMLILGADFWRAMGIVPDLRHNEWFFSDLPEVSTVDMTNETVLTEDQEKQLNEVLNENFSLIGNELGCTNRAEHVITTDSRPIKQRYYRVSPVMQAHIDKELDEMLKQGIVEPSKSAWSSPIVMVKKKDGSMRMCIDYRKLNAVSKRDSYPLPQISDTLDKLRDAKYLSSMDIKSAYWQIPVAESSKEYTAFTVPNRGLFQFKRLPFGLHNAPATWQRLIDNVLGADLEPHVFVYLDDIVIVTSDFEKHLEILGEVFKRLREANLTVSREKCQFCKPQMKYLGYVVDRNGLHVDPDKVKAMLEVPTPRNVTEVRRIVGTFSWYRRFIKDFSSLIEPITALLRKSRKFIWTADCDTAFRKIKECLVQAPVLSCPDYSLPFVVQCDSSGFGIGAVLVQPQLDGTERVISYLSRSLTRQERNYSTTERECLAVVWSVNKLRPYLDLVPFTVVTDHYSLVWLQNMKQPTGRLARWQVQLQQYDLTIIHRKGKEHIVPDMLSRAVPEITTADITIQTKDKWYLRLLTKVRSNPLKFSGWRETNGRLYKFVKSDYPELRPEIDNWKVVVPKEERMKIMTEAHEPPTSGHMGIYKTFSRIAEKYFWPKMRCDISRFIGRCRACLQHKPEMGPPKDKMVSHTKPTRPWEVISTDLIGLLPRSKKGNTFLLVVTDYHSKFVLLQPLRKATSEAVARFMENNVFLLFGVPSTILCDNGVQFRGRPFVKLTEQYKVRLKLNANYHPRANPTERTNRTLKTMLRIYLSDNHRDWDLNLDKIACCLRNSVNETTRLTPYFVNFGRNMVLNGDEYKKKTIPEVDENTEISARQRNEVMAKVFEDVKRRLEVAAEKSVERYNLRRRHVEYLPNEIVFRRNYAISDASKFFSKKLAPKYIGPFVIKKRVSPWTYELQDEDGNSKGIWHIKDLKAPSDTEADDSIKD